MFFCGAIKLTGNIPRSRFQAHGSILCSSPEQLNLQVTFLDPGSWFYLMFFCGAIKLTGNISRSRFQVHGSILCSSAEQFNLQVTFLDPGSMFMVLSYVLLRILVTEFWFQVPGTWFQVPGSRFLAPGFWFQVTCS